jgi:Flp pilus assembly protein TadG
MNAKTLFRKTFARPHTASEAGQSIVLIALALIALIGFLGIALDVGFVFARGSQLQAAIDSAALAGVTELGGWAVGGSNNPQIEARARTKSAQFMNANGMPVTVTTSLNEAENLYVMVTPLGARQYSITATWPVETFFLKVLGFNEPINLTRSATAAVFSLANVYASRRIEDGILSTSNQSVFGQNICTSYGDPFSPLNSPWAPGPYSYQYRIMIPPDYPYDIVRVELMDPDSINKDNPAQPLTIPYTAAAAPYFAPNTFTTGTCTGNRKDACLIPTGELALVNNGTLPLDRVNPYWFWRIDENRGTGAAPGNGSCGSPSSYNADFNTRTLFELFYWKENPDGTIERVDLARYTGQVGGGRDAGNHDTDMRWVSPGAAQSYDQPVNVPIDPGSPKNFEINLTSDVPGILVEQGTGIRYINLNVTAQDGASENGYELWAGPANYVQTIASDANSRNIQVLNSPGSHSSKGVTIFASGNLPMNSNFGSTVDIPLVYVGPDLAGQDIYVSMFDSDSGAQPPITFYFDSIAIADWSLVFGQNGVPDPDGQTRNCRPGSCNNTWVSPQYQITVPGDDPNDPDYVPFYGGRLTARYRTGFGDTYVWQITIDGLPYLTR